MVRGPTSGWWKKQLLVEWLPHNFCNPWCANSSSQYATLVFNIFPSYEYIFFYKSIQHVIRWNRCCFLHFGVALSFAEFMHWWPQALKQFHFQKWLNCVMDSWWLLVAYGLCSNIHCQIGKKEFQDVMFNMSRSKHEATTPRNDAGCNRKLFLDDKFIQFSWFLVADMPRLPSFFKTTDKRSTWTALKKQFGIVRVHQRLTRHFPIHSFFFRIAHLLCFVFFSKRIFPESVVCGWILNF